MAPVALIALSCGAAVISEGEDYQLGSPVRTIVEMVLHGRLSRAFYTEPAVWKLCLELLEIHLGSKVQQGSSKLLPSAVCEDCPVPFLEQVF